MLTNLHHGGLATPIGPWGSRPTRTTSRSWSRNASNPTSARLTRCFSTWVRGCWAWRKMTSRRGNPGGMVSGVDVDICYFHAIVFVSNIYIYIRINLDTHTCICIYIYCAYTVSYVYIYTHSHTHITHIHTYNDDSFMYSLLLQSVDFGSWNWLVPTLSKWSKPWWAVPSDNMVDPAGSVPIPIIGCVFTIL